MKKGEKKRISLGIICGDDLLQYPCLCGGCHGRRPAGAYYTRDSIGIGMHGKRYAGRYVKLTFIKTKNNL